MSTPLPLRLEQAARAALAACFPELADADAWLRAFAAIPKGRLIGLRRHALAQLRAIERLAPIVAEPGFDAYLGTTLLSALAHHVSTQPDGRVLVDLPPTPLPAKASEVVERLSRHVAEDLLGALQRHRRWSRALGLGAPVYPGTLPPWVAVPPQSGAPVALLQLGVPVLLLVGVMVALVVVWHKKRKARSATCTTGPAPATA